jgi:hypothetical protein
MNAARTQNSASSSKSSDPLWRNEPNPSVSAFGETNPPRGGSFKLPPATLAKGQRVGSFSRPEAAEVATPRTKPAANALTHLAHAAQAALGHPDREPGRTQDVTVVRRGEVEAGRLQGHRVAPARPARGQA